MTFDATVNPVAYEGGVPVFIDTEYDTWNMLQDYFPVSFCPETADYAAFVFEPAKEKQIGQCRKMEQREGK